MRVLTLIALLALSYSFSSEPALARTWHVTALGNGDAPTIQAAIDAAATNDTVLVAAGTYSENLRLAKSLALLSEGGANATVIDGRHRSRVLTINPTGAGGPLIAGFTLRNGRTDEFIGHLGGGIRVACPGTTIRDNVIEYNSASSTARTGTGGGIYVGLEAPSCLIENNVIQNNQAGSQGGGIYAHGCIARGNVILANQAFAIGGGADFSHSTFVDNVIANNFAVDFAGGVVVRSGELVNNTIVGNRILSREWVAIAVFLGGQATAVVRGNIIANNGTPTAPGQGVSIQCYPQDSRTIIECNDVWGNDVDAFQCAGATILSNLSADPLFCNAQAADYHLASNSPCAPQFGSCGLVGALPPACSATAIQTLPWSHLKSLYR